MEQYNVTGMSCAACVARVEKAVANVDGVSSVSVSLLTNSMAVEGNADFSKIKKAVEDAGYGCSQKGNKNSKTASFDEDSLKDKETPKLLKRLIASVVFVLILMYFSMGHMMWGWPLPSFFDGNCVAVALVQMILAAIVMIINHKFFVSGFKGIIHRSPNMDTLVALGSSVSFLWSVYGLFMMTYEQVQGGDVDVWMDQLYFESAAMILALITVGKTLESYSKGKTTNALKALMKLAPKTATVERNGKEETISIDELAVGDIFVVRPGESIPVDGVVIEGVSAVDESALTGESIPADKEVGSKVSAATINKSGFLRCRASRVGEDTTISQIIKMVSDAAATKAPIAKIADKVSGVFVPVVISIAVVTFVVWCLIGREFSFCLARGISVLVISCPCALGLATPVAIMVGNGVGAKNGILFKNAQTLENAGKVQIVALDKTGTITQGQPVVTDVIPVDSTESELISLAYSLEKKSEHPLALAVVNYAEEKGLDCTDVENFNAVAGKGIVGKVSGKEVFGGNLKFIQSKLQVSDAVQAKLNDLSTQGKTALIFALEGKIEGIIAVADVIREDSPEAIAQLKNMGIKVVMLTGDNEQTARAIGDSCGVDSVIAGILPGEKEKEIAKLSRQGKVAMVGDGINDAPALTRADIGIAIGAGTDVAIDAADIVLENSRLSDVPAAIRLSRSTLKNIHENLFWAFCYNIIGIPLAAGVFIPLFGWQLNPMFGAAAMSVSSFLVVSNALRLNLLKIYSSKHDKKIKIKTKESTVMEKTIKVNGMMCPHCEARVKQVLEALPQVDTAVPSHTEGNVVLTLNAVCDDAALKSAIEGAGYEYVG